LFGWQQLLQKVQALSAPKMAKVRKKRKYNIIHNTSYKVSKFISPGLYTLLLRFFCSPGLVAFSCSIAFGDVNP
jgi:hypothetical protein